MQLYLSRIMIFLYQIFIDPREGRTKIMQSLENFHYIKLSPNPARDYTIVEYTLETATDAMLQITDLTGKILVSQSIYQNQNQEIIDTKNFNSGNYLISIIIDGNVLETIQLNVIK